MIVTFFTILLLLYRIVVNTLLSVNVLYIYMISCKMK